MRARRVHVVLLAVVAVAFTVKAQRYLLKKYLFSSLSDLWLFTVDVHSGTFRTELALPAMLVAVPR